MSHTGQWSVWVTNDLKKMRGAPRDNNRTTKEKQTENTKKQQKTKKQRAPHKKLSGKSGFWANPKPLKKQIHKQFEVNNSSQKIPKAEVKKIDPPCFDEFEVALQTRGGSAAQDAAGTTPRGQIYGRMILWAKLPQ